MMLRQTLQPLHQTHASVKGYTLIELMIVVTIVAILGAIAYPSYTNYVLRGKRAEGRAFLMDVAARQERLYSDCNKYAAATGGANNCAGSGVVKAGSTSESGHYTLGINIPDAPDNQQFTLSANPNFDDDECNVLTLSQAGARGITGTGSVNDCWGR